MMPVSKLIGEIIENLPGSTGTKESSETTIVSVSL
jgi:hypothetical protein